MTEQDVARVLKRRGALPALMTAVGIFVALIVLGFLGATFSSLAVIADPVVDGRFFGSIWSTQLVGSLAGPLPIALGVFLCFWQIAPIAASLRLGHVVTRAVLAATVGALLLFVVTLAYALAVWGIEVAGSMLGSTDTSGPTSPAVLAFRSLSVLVNVLPVVVLGAILLWGWLQRHPLDYKVSGTLDEV
ncbi:MAG: hypothetical protein ABIR17_09195 [Pseudolysinimonas sp.]|uniref:hypothetical protein n=1 Tax=Pseudolysinimonas sp. TaxID=2680009 RepID=UPI0032658A49